MTEIPKNMEQFCKTSRSTFVSKKSISPSVSYDDDTSLTEHEKLEKRIYDGSTAAEVAREMIRGYDDCIRYSNNSLYLELKKPYIKENTEETYESEMCRFFGDMMDHVKDVLDNVEHSVSNCLSLKRIDPRLISHPIFKEMAPGHRSVKIERVLGLGKFEEERNKEIERYEDLVSRRNQLLIEKEFRSRFNERVKLKEIDWSAELRQIDESIARDNELKSRRLEEYDEWERKLG